MGTPWTPEEKEYLAENWGVKPQRSIEKHLGRSEHAVKTQVVKLGLGAFLECGDYVTFNQLLHALGITNSGTGYKLINWVRDRGLPVRYKTVNRCRFRVVYLDAFWKWAEQNRGLIDFARVEENILGKEPDWLKEKRRADLERAEHYKIKAPWSPAEDKRLRDLLRQHKYTYLEISKAMGRTTGAIQRRIRDLDIKDWPVAASKYNPWSVEDLQKLGQLINSGYGYEVMAERLGRSAKAIQGKVFMTYQTEKLDAVRRMMNGGGWGAGVPERTVKVFYRRSEFRQELQKLHDALAWITKGGPNARDC